MKAVKLLYPGVAKMSLYKIIKAAEVEETRLEILPLKSSFAVRGGGAGKVTSINPGVEPAKTAIGQKTAAGIIRRARASAEEIMQQARLSAEQIKQDAYQDAYQGAFEQGKTAGYEAGYRDGMAKAKEEASTLRAQALDILTQAEEIRKQTLAAMEQEIIDLAVEIAEKLLSAQLTLEPATVLQVAKEALHLVANRLDIIIYVSPLEFEVVESKKNELLSILPARAELRVIADQAVSPGGCRIETEHSQVNATLETRREELFKVLYAD
jgi:flagellar assembly protein FliH